MVATRVRTTAHRCRECGAAAPKWLGRCPECHSWGAVEQAAGTGPRPGSGAPLPGPAVPLTEVDPEGAAAHPCGIEELDRVLGGGLVAGAVILLAGEPGVGKSTLLLSTAASWAERGGRCLVVTGEESAAQVRRRADRVGAAHPLVFLAAETTLEALLAHVEAVDPSLLVVDSVQTIGTDTAEGTAGGVTQVRAVAAALIEVAKRRGLATLLVGHVTKDGTVAGPRVLEHLVDAVLHFEGDRHSRLRLLRAVKNRFGPADELGCFDLRSDGLLAVPDPAALLLSQRPAQVPGTCVTVVAEGRRSLGCELQALVVPAPMPPRRVVHGLDAARVTMILAVLERRTPARLGSSDVYVSTVGGLRVNDPAADLAVALAAAGAASDRVVRPGLVAIGELGLAGDVRPVASLRRRLAEAARLGYTEALVPASSDQPTTTELRVSTVDTIDAALGVLD